MQKNINCKILLNADRLFFKFCEVNVCVLTFCNYSCSSIINVKVCYSLWFFSSATHCSCLLLKCLSLKLLSRILVFFFSLSYETNSVQEYCKQTFLFQSYFLIYANFTRRWFKSSWSFRKTLQPCLLQSFAIPSCPSPTDYDPLLHPTRNMSLLTSSIHRRFGLRRGTFSMVSSSSSAAGALRHSSFGHGRTLHPSPHNEVRDIQAVIYKQSHLFCCDAMLPCNVQDVWRTYFRTIQFFLTPEAATRFPKRNWALTEAKQRVK